MTTTSEAQMDRGGMIARGRLWRERMSAAAARARAASDEIHGTSPSKRREPSMLIHASNVSRETLIEVGV